MKEEHTYLNPYYDPNHRGRGPKVLKSRRLLREYKGWRIYKRACVYDCVLEGVCHERLISVTAAKNYIDEIFHGNSSGLALIAWNLARLGLSPSDAKTHVAGAKNKTSEYSPLKPYA
jgi:hypothetical protein